MKTKTANKIINEKFGKFLKSIEDEKVRNMVRKNTIITGGCIASMLLKEKVNDFDLYFRNLETVKAVAAYYVNKFEDIQPGYAIDIITDKEEGQPDRVKIKVVSDGVAHDKEVEVDEGEIQNEEDNIKHIFEPAYISSNAITLTDQFQLIIRFYGEPEEIHNNYDFVHCTNYWDSSTRQITLNKDALESLITRELRYMGSRYPLASIIRSRKFIQRGWSINAGQYLKMALQLDFLDLHNLKTLEDQLTGVDLLYFRSLIEAIPKEKRPDDKVDHGYLMTIISKFF